MANTLGNKHDAAIARVWDFPLPLSRESVGIRLKNWTEAGNFRAVAEDHIFINQATSAFSLLRIC
jgi:hypothetical protein